jgi:predicted dehydrogenase
LIESGVHTLIEKPVTQTVAEAEALIAAAGRSGAVLAVGHSERFNPAVAAARPHIKDPRFIEVHRLGTRPERSLDIDVVLDLMIHDLDLILSIVQSRVESVEAVGVPVLTPRIDIANARLRFANGCIANLTASRISREGVRKIRFFQRDAYVSIDTGARDVEMWSVVPQEGAAPKISGGKLAVSGDEPLKNELEDFVAAIRDRRAPAVSGEEGRAALALAVRIVELMGQP